ncbi:unnamed protein product [Ambrosiozyma monospora]|uniref:Unnamed protein product n=1 Tax=Ambrosiozyma monospora TaxID=43982 RepID=A0A9W6YQN7_AMBMO|nr:unnamed protein product [Ambrosiozyma monospora]
MTVTDQQTLKQQEADALKVKGNEQLKLNNFEKAIDFYTKAIEIQPNAIYYSNRAQANIKLENYGLAINDANASIKLNKDYLKAYYRRAVAYSAILEYKKSLNDANLVLARAPKDKGCLSLKKELVKILNQLKFEKAIEMEDDKSHFKIDDVMESYSDLDVGYKGPELKVTKIPAKSKEEQDDLKIEITRDYIDSMIQLFKDGHKIPKAHVMAILYKANQLLMKKWKRLQCVVIPMDNSLMC